MPKKKPDKNGNVYESKSLNDPQLKLYLEEQQREHKIPDLAAVMLAKSAAKKSDMKQYYSNVRNNPPPPPQHEGGYQDSLSLDDEAAVIEDGERWNPPDDDESGIYHIQSESGGFPPSCSSRDKPVMANTATILPAAPEDIGLLKDGVTFERVAEKIYVILVAVNKQHPEKNTIETIKAGGDPLGGYAYTPESDHYLINCCDHMSLGVIPMAFRMVVAGYAGKHLIPLPEPLVFRHSSPQQRKLLKTFVEKHAGCDIQYVQSLCRS